MMCLLSLPGYVRTTSHRGGSADEVGADDGTEYVDYGRSKIWSRCS